jgi:outer membrane lipoprotein-sorting protein
MDMTHVPWMKALRLGACSALLMSALGGTLAALGAEATQGSAEAAKSPDELMTQIDRAQKDLHSLSADFVQLSRVKLFRQELRSEGRLLYDKGDGEAKAGSAKRPARLRWEYLRPDPSTVILDGERASLHMGTLPPQVFDTGKDPKLRAIFSQLRLWLGQGELASAKGQYDISLGGTPGKPALLMAPRPESPLAATFSRIELHVEGRSLQLLRLLLVERSGDEKEILFSKIQRNPRLDPQVFIR